MGAAQVAVNGAGGSGVVGAGGRVVLCCVVLVVCVGVCWWLQLQLLGDWRRLRLGLDKANWRGQSWGSLGVVYACMSGSSDGEQADGGRRATGVSRQSVGADALALLALVLCIAYRRAHGLRCGGV